MQDNSPHSQGLEREAPPSLGSRAVGGAVWTAGGQIFRTLSTIVTTVVVARIVNPIDYGIIAMAAPITAFVMLFQDLGLSQSVVQSKTIDSRSINSLFWFTILSSILSFVALVAISPLAAAFYGQASVGYVTAISAVGILISGVGVQHSAILARAMRFKAIAAADFIFAASSSLSTIILALYLKNFWALAIGPLFGFMAQSAMLMLNSGWRPNMNIAVSGISSHLRFGGGVAGFNIVNYFVRNIDNVLIAKAFGPASVGYYDQSYKMMMAPMNAINAPVGRVMMPLLSRLQDYPARYRRAFLIACRFLLILLTPGLITVAIFSRDVVTLLLGKDWVGASEIFFWLSLTGVVQPLANATGWLFLSSGRTTDMFRWGLFSAVFTIVGFLVGLKWGAEGVAASLFVTALIRLPLLLPYSAKGTRVSALDMYRLALEPVVGIAAATCAAALAGPFISQPLARIALVLIAAYGATFAAFFMSKGGREMIADCYTLLSGAARKAFKPDL